MMRRRVVPLQVGTIGSIWDILRAFLLCIMINTSNEGWRSSCDRETFTL